MLYHPVNLISSAIEHSDLPAKPEEGVCAITGETCLCLPRKALLGKSFTNIDLLSRPDSEVVGIDAYQALKYKWERMNSWICDGKTFKRLDRVGVRKEVFAEELPGVWIGYATTSYKKHGALRTPINTGKSRRWLFELDIVDCSDMELVLDWWNRLNAYLCLGIGRSSLESGNASPYIIKSVGLDLWIDFYQWSAGKTGSPLYRFLCYLLPSQKELKNENH